MEHVSSARAGRESGSRSSPHTLHWSPGAQWAEQMRTESRESLPCVCLLLHGTWALELGTGGLESCLRGDPKWEL